jgi:hypothetical protein
MIPMTNQDLDRHIVQYITKTASVLGIERVELQGSDALLAQIQRRDPVTSALLEAYLAAYRSWHDCHNSIAMQGLNKGLDLQEKTTFEKCMVDRHMARQALANRLEAISSMSEAGEGQA